MNDVLFENSTRIALFFAGKNVQVLSNTFLSGLDVGISAFGSTATGLLIQGNLFGSNSPASGYRGGGIGLYGSSGTVKSNILRWTGNGDVDGRDVDLPPGGGPQIALITTPQNSPRWS